MNQRRRRQPQLPKRSFDKFIELATGRVGKIAGFIAAIGILLAAGDKVYDNVALRFRSGPCLVVTDVDTPIQVRYSEWDSTKFKLSGLNNCPGEPGVYVAFLPRTASDTRFLLGVPHGDLPECKSLFPAHEQRCWGGRKPVVIGKGKWDLDVLLPPLTRLTDPRRIEKIVITWEVRDMEHPTKPPISVDFATIDIQNDV